MASWECYCGSTKVVGAAVDCYHDGSPLSMDVYCSRHLPAEQDDPDDRPTYVYYFTPDNIETCRKVWEDGDYESLPENYFNRLRRYHDIRFGHF